MLSVPPSILRAKAHDASQRKQAQNSLLGNGFHISAIMAIFAVLPTLCASKFNPASLQPDADLRARITGTPWDPCKLAAFPGLVDATALVVDMRLQLQDFCIPEPT